MASTITSLGIASGNDFSSIVEELVKLKKQSVTRQTTKRSNANTIELSGVASLKSGLSTFKSTLTAFTENRDTVFNAKKITTSQAENANLFTVEAKDDASNADFQLGVVQLAKSEKLTQSFKNDNGFTNSFEAGKLTFDLGKDSNGKDRSFSIDVSDGDTLETIRKRINSNDMGVTASLVKTSAGYSLSIDAGVTGDAASPLKITASDQKGGDGKTSLSSLVTDGNDLGSWTRTQKAQDAIITVDGQEVHSSSNTFDDNQVAGLKISVNKLSEAATAADTDAVSNKDGALLKTYNVKVATDSDTTADKIMSFVNGYNTLISSLTSLSKSNTYTDGVSNEDGGDLAGDGSVTSLKSTLQSMISGFKGSEEGMTIFDMGLKFNKDGTLSFYRDDFNSAMAKSPNAVANLFNDKDTGLFSKLDTYVNGYTKSSGILDQRTDLLNKEKSRIADQQTRDTETIEKYQAQLTKTYANLDSLMAGFSSSLSSLSSVLSSLPSSSSKS